MPVLQLLHDVCWSGEPVPGDRPAALLSALALAPGGVSDHRLVEDIWRDAPPASPLKALQVLVSRVRSIVGYDAVARYDGGYRLTLEPDDVDLWQVRRLVREAEAALATGGSDALAASTRAEELLGRVPDAAREAGPRAELLTEATLLTTRVARLRGLALAAAGRSEEALGSLTSAHDRVRDDVPVLVALLRCEAAVVGTPAALARYDAYRLELADRLGTDPAPELQRLHQELLAADRPVRTGLLFDGDPLLGREGDLQRLRVALASGRLTTILGPGGIGKTRIAQVLARDSTLPRVHVVELVGVADGGDVIAEVGAALGVRGSVAGRHTLTPAQQADVRGRMAQELDASPTLLVLDNCEHVLETVASLVAFLLVTTRDLSILTTSRAPLRIGAERVVPLSQLADDDSVALFMRRARAVRPDADLDPATMARVVDRLDGLPLAIELAAARVRTMSVAEIASRLDDRFELLRSRDRAAPARHRTLTAVIGWSWDLLDDEAQRALAWLSVFHDGFDEDAAVALLGPGGADLVETLVEQSLLVVSEVDGVTRLRALETIREYAAQRLSESGQADEARRAQDGWASSLATAELSLFTAEDQPRAVVRLLREENNLTDVLRRALEDGDGLRVAELMAALGSLWTITGNHPRVFSVADAVKEALVDLDPPAASRAVVQEAAALLLVHLSWLPDQPFERLPDAMRRWGTPETPWARCAYAMFVAGGELGDAPDRLAAAAADEPDPDSRAWLLLWAALASESLGEVRRSAGFAREGLEQSSTSLFVRASLHGELAQLCMVLGDHREAARHSEAAWPILMELHAVDDALSLRVGAAMAPLMEGRPDESARILDELGADHDNAQVGSRMVIAAARAEIALAKGETEDALARFDDIIDLVSDVEIPGMAASPWLLLAVAVALVARVHHSVDEADPRAGELRDQLVAACVDLDTGAASTRDLPLTGVALAALGGWCLRFGTDGQREDGVHLLAIAERWAYNRTLPSMAWPPLAALAERAMPGRVDALCEEYADRPGMDLLPTAVALVSRLTSSG